MSNKVYGRAYKISGSDAKAYRRVDRSLKANPIGVTAMSSVNGRGAATRSARAVAQGKTRSQRIARAESVYRNGEPAMAGILKNKRGTSARKKSAGRKSSARKSSSGRRKVPGTSYYRTSGGRYQNSAGKFVKASSVRKTSSSKRKSSSAKAAPKTAKRRRTRKNASVGYSASYAAGHDRMKRSEAARKAARTRKRRQAAAAGPKGRTKTVGKYQRVRIKDPRTGKMKLSYMYETKGGKLRKIPARTLIKSGHKTAADIKRGRSKAAARIKREGSAFVANSKKGTGRQKRAGRRLAAYMAAKRSGKTVKQARAAALRKVPLARGDQFKGIAKAPLTTSRKRTKVRRNAKGKRKTVRKNAKRRVVRKSARVVRKNAKRRMVRKNAKRVVRRNPKRRVVRKKSTAVARRRRKSPAKTQKNSRARKVVRRGRRRTGARRSYRKNAFMANLKAAFQTGLFVTMGFLTHRILTNLIADKALANTMADNQAFQDWKKPAVGAGVMLIGIPAMGAIAPKRAIEVGAGMVASFIQSVIVSALNTAGQPNLVSSVAGYGNSRAYALRGTRRRRRGLRGGMERHATSIMPQYTPVRAAGQYMQAAAGQFQQAAAGQFQQAAAGEYFTSTGEYFTATGEYFAPQGAKGVGGYEPAGQLAMQASAGTHQVIRDGLRPDGDIDHALDVAEAAAGLGDPTQLARVGQQSQWIPNGPLWAGERAVNNNQATSEISAGILQRQGGNGILSAG